MSKKRFSTEGMVGWRKEYEIHMKNGETILDDEYGRGEDEDRIAEDFVASRRCPEGLYAARLHTANESETYCMKDVCYIKLINVTEAT